MRQSIIIMIDSEIMNMDHHMLIDIVLWVNQPSKQVQVRLSNQTYRATAQHLESIIPTIKALYDKITIPFTRLKIYKYN